MTLLKERYQGVRGWCLVPSWVPCSHLQHMFAFKSNVVGWDVFCNRDLVVGCVTRVVQRRQGSSSRSCGSRRVLPPQDPDLVRTHGIVPRSHLCAVRGAHTPRAYRRPMCVCRFRCRVLRNAFLGQRYAACIFQRMVRNWGG